MENLKTSTLIKTKSDSVVFFDFGRIDAFCDVAEHFLRIKEPHVAEHILKIYNITREKAVAALGVSIGIESTTFKNLDQAGFWSTFNVPEAL